MPLGRVVWLVGVAFLVLIVNVAISILYMVVYGHLIDPGHEEKYYQEHIQNAGPWCSIVAGVPLMFLTGFWVAGWWKGKPGILSAMVVWLAYALIDLAILGAVGLTQRVAILFGGSFLTKFVAVWAGAWVRVERGKKGTE